MSNRQETRARLVGKLRRFRDTGHADSIEIESDPTTERWGLAASEAMAFLKGVNSVGAIVVILSLLLVMAAGASKTYGQATQDIRKVNNGIQHRSRYAVSQSVDGGDSSTLPVLGGQARGVTPDGGKCDCSGGGQQKGYVTNLPPPLPLSPHPYLPQPKLPADAIQDDDEEDSPPTAPAATAASGGGGVGSGVPGGGEGGNNLAAAANALGGTLMVLAQLLQAGRMWRTRDAGSLSGLALFAAAGGCLLLFAASLASGALAVLAWGISLVCVGFYLWIYLRFPRSAEVEGRGKERELEASVEERGNELDDDLL